MPGMKPRFALELTNDAISLLERAGDAWVRIGEAQLSDPGLDRQLDALRQLAEARAPEGFITKLILPNSQILYLDVPDHAAVDLRSAHDMQSLLGVRFQARVATASMVSQPSWS